LTPGGLWGKCEERYMIAWSHKHRFLLSEITKSYILEIFWRKWLIVTWRTFALNISVHPSGLFCGCLGLDRSTPKKKKKNQSQRFRLSVEKFQHYFPYLHIQPFTWTVVLKILGVLTVCRENDVHPLGIL
jgi:hypothetical protein